MKKLFFVGLLLAIAFVACKKDDEAPVPSIIGFNPANGLPDSEVTITGTNFSEVSAQNKVVFTSSSGESEATVTSASKSTLKVKVPVLTQGNYLITVTVNGKTAVSLSQFIIVAPTKLAVSSVSASTAAAGSVINVSGVNFGTTTGNVTVSLISSSGSSTPLTITEVNESSLKISIPANVAPGSYTIRIKVGDETVDVSTPFTVTAPTINAVSISSISPLSGDKNTQITLKGKNFSFTSSSNKVVVKKALQSALNATVLEASDSIIKIALPSTVSPGPYDISVTVGTETANSPKAFTVTETTTPLPTITSFTPESGNAGSQITITGTNFSTTAASNTVTLVKGTNTPVSATVGAATATSLTVTLPSGIEPGAYTIKVKVGAQTTESATQFTVNHPAPTITSFTPSSGLAGSQITITGTNFSATGMENEVTMVQGVNTPIAATVSNATTTSLTITLPGNISTGAYNIRVKVHGHTVNSANQYTVNTPPPPPTVSSFAPTKVAVGGSFTINGTNFSATASDQQVSFVLGSNPPIAATILSATTKALRVKVPAGTPAGSYGVRITKAGSTVDLATPITVVAPHTVTSFTPQNAEEGGVITVTGTNFSTIMSEDTVEFYQDGIVTKIKVMDATATTLTILAPAPAMPGAHFLDLTINGLTVRAQGTWTMGAFSTPSITNFTPNPVLVGTDLIINGSNFSYSEEVLYVILIKDGTTSKIFADITACSPTQITVKIPGYLDAAEYTLKVDKGSKSATAATKLTITE